MKGSLEGRNANEEKWLKRERERETYRYFMPVSLPVDSLREIWWRGAKEPKLRAMMATVRNFARAAFTTLGLVAFVFPWSPFRPFRLWSVQAIETCMLDEEGEEDAVYNTERTH